MPELPEVETLKRQLKVLRGKKIKSVKIGWPKMVQPFSVRQFQSRVSGRSIDSIKRRAKTLIFGLDNKSYLAVHLRLTGQLIFQPSGDKLLIAGGHPQEGGTDNLPNKFTHIIITFSDNSVLYFNDMRKFGWMKLMSQIELDEYSSRHGYEAVSASFTLDKFKGLINRYPNRKIKQLLLDQKLIAGIGNIYADESCFYAKVLPWRVVDTLSDSEIKKLFEGIKNILKLSIAKKGTSFKDYVHVDGNKGGFVPYLNVYGRQGEKCKRGKCCGVIQKTRLAGRGTRFCACCQK
jgi:formamidopyrimidine-DNA glycosylase